MGLTRREFLAKTASAAALAAAVPARGRGAAASDAASKPNVLFIICDDLGWGDLGVFYQNGRRSAGEPAERTPNLDRMAAAGARLTDHYCGAPVCAPARATLLTGVHQGHADLRNNQFDKALEDNHNLARVLRGAGYATAAVGKWGLQGAPAGGPPNWPAHPLKRGFDTYFGYMRHRDGHQHYPIGDPWANGDRRFGGGGNAKKKRAPVEMDGDPIVDPSDGDGPDKQVWDNDTEVSAQLANCYTTDLFTARAKRWIADHARGGSGRPFFLYLAFDTPHASIELPTQAFPDGGGLNGGLQWVGRPGHAINTASGRPDSYYHPAFADAVDQDGRPWPDIYKRYATAVRRIDDCVGDLRALLSDLGIADNTLVVFTSDHGPTIESYLPDKITPEFFSCYGPFDGIKRDCWEGGIRVPAIACWPRRIPAGGVIRSPVGTWDWMATLAEAAGVPSPARCDGVSLMPALTGSGALRDREFLYTEYYFPGRTPNFPEFGPGHRGRLRDQMQTVRMGDLAGVRYDIQSAGDNFEIYDLGKDPKQSRNLASNPAFAALQKRMKELVIQCRRPNSTAPRPYDNEPMAAAVPDGISQGVEWSYYEGDYPWLPDLQAQQPLASGMLARPDLSPRKRDDRFGLRFAGYIEAPEEGVYTFCLAADTAAFLRIHHASVIDADYGYEGGAERRGTVRLKAGLHPFVLQYARAERGAPALSLAWERPGSRKEPVPNSAFKYSA